MNDQTDTKAGGQANMPAAKRGRVQEKLNVQAKSGGILIGPAADPDLTEYTVVILGVPRGGTTMVAGVAEKIGLNIGQNLGFNLEDSDFDRKPVAHMRDAINERNAKMPVWGWKYPTASNYLPRVLPFLRNPRFVVVWRDPLTAAMRSVELVARMELRPALQTRRSIAAIEMMITRQMRNIEFLKQIDAPSLLVSYEKTVRRPQEFIEQLASFMSMPVPADTSEILAFMEPESYK